MSNQRLVEVLNDLNVSRFAKMFEGVLGNHRRTSET